MRRVTRRGKQKHPPSHPLVPLTPPNNKRFGDYDPPTKPPAIADVKAAFGARGDGVSDDTAAFELAIAAVARRGVLYVPRGTYVITRRLDIDKQASGGRAGVVEGGGGTGLPSCEQKRCCL
jgi:hypothetical protein